MSQVNLKTGTNILYWRTTGMLLGGKPVKPVLLKNIQIDGMRFCQYNADQYNDFLMTNQLYFYMFCEQVWRTRQSVSRAGRAPSVKLQALLHVTFVPGILTLERELVRVHIAPRHSIPVRMQMISYILCCAKQSTVLLTVYF